MLFKNFKRCRGTESIVIILNNYAIKFPVYKKEYFIQKCVPSYISPKIYFYFCGICMMKYISGKTLNDVILNKNLTSEIINNIENTIKKLVYDFSIFHKDLHGRNIIIDNNNIIWIIDYGDSCITNNYNYAYAYSMHQIEKIIN